jgi:hypothetical protein
LDPLNIEEEPVHIIGIIITNVIYKNLFRNLRSLSYHIAISVTLITAGPDLSYARGLFWKPKVLRINFRQG